MPRIQKKLCVGFSRDIITPPLGINIPGHGMKPRIADGIITDLYVSCIAFSDGKDKAVLFNCDALGITNNGYEQISKKVAETCGLNPKSVYIACTHAHTACWVNTANNDKTPDNAFQRRLHHVFCDTAKLAFEDLHPTRIKIARGEVKNVAFIRRYRMKDGSLVTNPATGDPNIADFDGIQDESLQLVRFVREGAKEIVIANFGTHPDVVCGRKYNYDWPGYTAEYLRSAFSGQVEAVVLNGASGDSNHMNRFWEKGHPYKGADFAQSIARKIAGEALKIYDSATEIGANRVSFSVKVAQLEKNPYEPEEVPIAEKICQSVRETGDIAPELLSYHMSYKKAARILNNLTKPERIPVNLFGLQVGNLAFIGFSGEPFCETGMEIKSHSPMDMTIITCRTGGSNGYFPTRRAYAGEGYEREYSSFGPSCSETLAETAREMLEKMHRVALHKTADAPKK